MTQRHRPLICVACFLLFVVCGVCGLSAQTLQIINAEGHATTFTAAQIAKLPHTTVKVRDHDADAQFAGVLLEALLSNADIQLGDALRGPRMAEVLLMTAADGYKVAFALAECDPVFATREIGIILADQRDGKALNDKEGPFRIVAPGDKRPARWIRQVTELKLIVAK